MVLEPCSGLSFHRDWSISWSHKGINTMSYLSFIFRCPSVQLFPPLAVWVKASVPMTLICSTPIYHLISSRISRFHILTWAQLGWHTTSLWQAFLSKSPRFLYHQMLQCENRNFGFPMPNLILASSLNLFHIYCLTKSTNLYQMCPSSTLTTVCFIVSSSNLQYIIFKKVLRGRDLGKRAPKKKKGAYVL